MNCVLLGLCLHDGRYVADYGFIISIEKTIHNELFITSILQLARCDLKVDIIHAMQHDQGSFKFLVRCSVLGLCLHRRVDELTTLARARLVLLQFVSGECSSTFTEDLEIMKCLQKLSFGLNDVIEERSRGCQQCVFRNMCIAQTHRIDLSLRYDIWPSDCIIQLSARSITRPKPRPL